MPRSSSALLPLSKVWTPFFASLLACLFLIASPLFAQQPAALVTQPINNFVRTVLPGNVHPLARADFDRGEAPSDMPLARMLLVLKRSDQQEKALRDLIENQQYKKSPSYHQWLTPVEFGARFGPADSDIAAVTNWLQASGFQVAQVSKGRTVIEFSGTAGLVKQAFGTAIHEFDVKGEQHWANVSNPSIPTAIAPVVAGVDSLHNFLKKAQNTYVGNYSEKTKQLTSPGPNFTFPGGCVVDNTGNCYALAPYDFATIYDLLPLWTAPTPINGTGQTIAIVGRTDINPADATTFWSLFGLDGTHAPQPTLVITHNGPAPGVTGDEDEADIDTQWSGAAAPGATINFVTSASTETTDGVDLSAIYIVDNNLAPVMSESYGQCEAFLGSGGVQFYGLLWEQAAAQGITAMVSTGDNGSAGCDSPGSPAQNGLNVNGLASTQFNVAVGGTDFAQFTTPPSTYWSSTNAAITQESALGYIPETTWNSSCANPLFQFLQGGTTNAETNCNNPQFANFLNSIGGSGGKSLAWLKPAWQTGTPSDNARDLPDVSLFASSGFLGSFYVICQMDQTGGVCDLNNFLGFGGTSVSAPAFAGIMALVNQKWGLQGNPNFVLYKLPAKQANAFHDVPTGSTIAVPCFKGTPNCTTNVGTDAYGVLSGYSTGTAYDLATGLGSVDAAQMVNNWNKVTFTPSITTLTLNVPANTTHGASVPVTITVTPASPIPTGDVTLLVNPGTPGSPGIDAFTLASGTVSGTTNLLPGGTYKVIAHYEGDTSYGGSYSSASASITVNPENSSVYMPGLVTPTGVSSTVIYGTGGFASGSYLLRADVQNSQGKFCTSEVLGEIACPTGTVTFTDNGSPLDGGAFKLNSLGYTEDQVIQLTGGSHNLAGNYGGDASYKASTTSTVVTVTKATTAISDVSAPATANTGAQFTITATVTTSSGGVAPTGTVTFLAGGTPLTGTVQYSPVNGSGSSFASLGASLTTSINTPGTYAITATYSGDGNYTNVTQSNSVNIVISTPTTTTLTSSLNPANQGVAVTFTATVTTTGAIQPTGTVTFNDGTTALGTGTLNGSHVATFTTSTLAGGTHSITAVYGGDANNASSTSAPLTQNIIIATTTALTSSASSIASGASVTFTATVTGASPTGTVTFKNGAASLGTGTLNNAGIATLATTALVTIGTDSITAVYPGDVNNLPSTSSALTETVTAATFTISATPATQTITSGGTATVTVTVTPQGIYTSPITFTATLTPTSSATVTFNPTTVTPNGSTATTTLTITGATSGAQQAANDGRKFSALNASLLWTPIGLAGLFLIGRRKKSDWRVVRRFMLAAALALIALTMFGCGGSSSHPTKTYQVQITATSAGGGNSGAVTTSASVAFTAQ